MFEAVVMQLTFFIYLFILFIYFIFIFIFIFFFFFFFFFFFSNYGLISFWAPNFQDMYQKKMH